LYYGRFNRNFMSRKNLTQISIFMGIQTDFSTQFLIDEIAKVATHPYSEWKIGMGEKIEDEGCLSTVVFNPQNGEVALRAYQYFVGLGMSGKPSKAGAATYVYLFKEAWQKSGKGIF